MKLQLVHTHALLILFSPNFIKVKSPFHKMLGKINDTGLKMLKQYTVHWLNNIPYTGTSSLARFMVSTDTDSSKPWLVEVGCISMKVCVQPHNVLFWGKNLLHAPPSTMF